MAPKKPAIKDLRVDNNGVQQGKCTDRKGRSGQSFTTLCVVCSYPNEFRGEECRFRGLRKLSSDGKTCFIWDDSNQPKFLYTQTFASANLRNDLTQLQRAIAQVLRPVVQKMLVHSQRNDAVMKSFETEYRLLCDSCHGAICVSSFLQGLLQDICTALDGPNVPDSDTGSDTQTQILLRRAGDLRTLPVLSPDDLHAFETLWALQTPLLVDSFPGFRPEIWAPSVFIRGHEDEMVRMITHKGEDISEVQVTLKEFVRLFKTSEEERGSVFKLKDYPPSQSFSSIYPDHSFSFQDSLPFPAYTSDRGILNLASHIPTHINTRNDAKKRMTAAIKPDLGPKLYLATRDHGHHTPSSANFAMDAPTSGMSVLPSPVEDAGAVLRAPIQDDLHDIPETRSSDDHQRRGSTRLHLDMSGAVNLMVEDLSGKGALWTIFAAEDTDRVRAFLRGKYHLSTSLPCPIHAQKYYLGILELRELFIDQGVTPYIFTQRKGQAVFIPAGCAHQVSNNGPCIKIAVDFISPSQLAVNQQLAYELQRESIEDIVGLEAVLLHSWHSIREQLAILPQDSQALQARKRMSSMATPSVKRVGIDIVTHRARKRFRRRHGEADEGRHQHCCPDPDCSAGSASERRYTWDSLYRHIIDVHGRVMPKWEIWRTFEVKSEGDCKSFLS
ncbi:hypothetical protein NM688_g3617 [Phlebia brevispora]|uniref:Uncharacterized protein n=1 Tax=Phlebia brevispora TaxID=194682 RepID=A0ACC1T5F6_9APHY|nr:hypothetical protein NM688_g3617 [Phlebia brevispora]